MMAPTSTQQSPLHTAVLAALQEHGTGRWPTGVAAAIAEQVGSTTSSVQSTKCRLAKGLAARSPANGAAVPTTEPPPVSAVPEPPAEPPVPEVEQQLGLGLPTANGNGVHQGGAPDDNGEQAAPAAAVAQVSAEEPAQPIPADAADPAAEALAELQHNDAIGLQLVVDGKAPSSAACRAAGLPGTWRLTRWPQIRELTPEQLLANQQEQAATDAALEQSLADGVAQAQAERAERTQLCERHRQILLASAITEERISLWETVADPRDLPPALQSWGKKALPCMATTWLTVSGALVPQIRVDTPIPLKNGRPARYLFPKDSGGIVGTDAAFERDWGNAHVPMLMVEGTKQFQAAASTINPEVPFAIPFGLAGCWGWSSDLKPSADLLALPVEGRDVLVAFDADVASNWMVWEAARRLEKYLLGELMARSVRFLINPGTGGASDGLDDLLGRQPTLERRVKLLRHLIDTAIEHKAIKAPKRPAKLTAFFDGANFKPASCLDYLSGENHLAMSGDQSVAVYQGGVFHNGTSLWWTRLVSETLGDDYRPEFEASVTKIALAQLKTEGLVIPFQQPRPVINFQNCLLDVRELRQRDHTPEHLTLIQLPHRWNPGADCPVFLRWVEQVAPGQLDGLLDVCCQMLDLSEWPRLIVFLTGPTRSGKSTWIRILNALVGAHLRANVSLHDLSRSGQDKFATSSLFGKVLNTFADLSAEDLQDLSMVKVLTGGDEFEAQRKHGHRFQMRNQAMLVFSANTVPATSESSGAFLARVAHFEFPHSFQGREDKTIEERILRDEIPGVLRLMVEALHKRKQRGNFLPLDEGRQQAFAERTDRVRMFLAERTAPGNKGPRCIPRSELYQLFCSWVEEEHGGKAGRILGKHKFNERVRLAGVGEFKPEGGSWRWDRVEVDPETAEPAPPETAEPGDGVDKSGFDVDKGPASALSGPKLPSKTAEGKTAVVEPVLVGGEAGSTAVSAVSPYCTTPIQNTQLKLKPAQWVETADTAEELTEAAAVAPALSTPADELVPADHTGPLLFDLETRSTDELFDPVEPGGRPFITLVGTPYGQNTDPTALVEYVRAGGTLVAHNGFGFDFLALAHHHGLDLLAAGDNGQLVDTMVLAMLREHRIFTPVKEKDIAENFKRNWSLDSLAKRYAGVGKTDDITELAIAAAKGAGIKSRSSDELVKKGLALIEPGDPQLREYLRGDIAALQAIADHYDISNLSDYERREMRVQARLANGVCLQGIRVDVALVDRKVGELEAEAEAGRQWLGEQGFSLVNEKGKPLQRPLGSPPNKELFGEKLQALGVRDIPRTEGGSVSVGKEGLGPLLVQAVADGNADLVKLLEVALMLSGQTHVYGILRDELSNGWVHPSISTPQASGRCSITKPAMTVFGKRGEALLAQRATILPDSDADVLWACDLCQIDMRAMAVHSQDPNYLALFLPGINKATGKPFDAHQGIADRIGVSRSNAKRVGHGWNYGMEYNTMVGREGVEPQLATAFIRGMEREFRRLVAWKEVPRQKGRELRNRLDNGFGRPMQCNPDRAHTMAPSLMGQGTARDLMMECILRLPAEIAGMLRIQVHDELVFSLPRDRAQELADQIQDLMTFQWAPRPGMTPVWVLNSSTQFGNNWAECYAGAERLRLVDEETGERFWFSKD